MNLEIQIQSLIYSFVYGLFFSYLLNLNYRILFMSRRLIQIFANFFFILDNVFLYFILLRYINQGIFHTYFFLLLVLGFIVGNTVTKKIRFKNWFFKRKKDIQK